MSNIRHFLLSFVALIFVNATIIDGAFARGAPDGFADLVDDLTPAVVNISTAQTISRPGVLKTSDQQALSLGSGFIVTSSGIVVTNNHVIQKADEIKVTLSDGREYTAILRGKDEETDLAVLQMQEVTGKMPFVKFGDSNKARVGDWVIAIGNPFGLGGSVSAGIISASNRNIQSGLYDDYIQTDAAINRGNSGGPLFDTDGNVIGVNTAIFSQTGGSVGVGFAVSSDLAANIVKQIIDNGVVRRGFLGVTLRDIEKADVTRFGLKNTEGAFVRGVTVGASADIAGIKTNDVIVKFDGKKIKVTRDLNRAIADAPVDRKLPVEVIRNAQLIKLNVMLKWRGETLAQADQGSKNFEIMSKTAARASGLTMESPSVKIRNMFGIKGPVEGVVITSLDPESPAANIVQQGDVIREIAWEPVVGPKEAAEHLERLRKINSGPVQILVQRGDLQFYQLLKP